MTAVTTRQKQINDSVYNKWSWQHTTIFKGKLSNKELEQLCVNRKEKAECLPNDRQRLVDLLCNNHYVFLGEDNINKLTDEGIKAEIKLGGFSKRWTGSKKMKKRLLTCLLRKIPKFEKLEDHGFIRSVEKPYFSHVIKVCGKDKIDYIISDNFGLYKFDSKKLKWNQWFKYPDHDSKDNPLRTIAKDDNIWANMIRPKLNTLCYDAKNDYIYFFEHTHDKLLRVNCKTKVVEIVELDVNKVNVERMKDFYVRAAVLIKNQMHIFCSKEYFGRSVKHFVINMKTNKVLGLGEFEQIRDVIEVRYLARKGIILLRFQSALSSRVSVLYSYNILKREWCIIPIAFPQRIGFMKYGMIPTRNNEYIIVYPRDCDHKKGEYLRVIDLSSCKCQTSRRLMNSNVKLPKNCNITNVMVVGSEYEEKLTVFGYIRHCWYQYKIGESRFPPQYLIKLIGCWYANTNEDYLYLFDGSPRLTQWRIKVGDIVHNIQQF